LPLKQDRTGAPLSVYYISERRGRWELPILRLLASGRIKYPNDFSEMTVVEMWNNDYVISRLAEVVIDESGSDC
jgi:hypothetical protein